MKRSLTAGIAMVLGTLYAIFALWYWFIEVNHGVNPDTIEALATEIALNYTLPHTLAASFGALANIIGFFANSRLFIIIAAILYTVALILFPDYYMFVIFQMILAYIAIFRIKKKAKNITK